MSTRGRSVWLEYSVPTTISVALVNRVVSWVMISRR